jgi:hypothetical protein
MYEDKLKKTLLKKIKKMKELDQADPTKYKQIADWDDSDFEFALASGSLSFEIDELLLDTAFWPLTGLSTDDIHLINDYIKNNVQEYGDPSCSETLEKYMNIQLVSMKEQWKERLIRLKPLILKSHIGFKTYHIYNQIIKCYVYGLFESCCVLCRAITEATAKSYIKNMGQGDLLRDEVRSVSSPSIRAILEKLGTPTQTLDIYSRIQRKANNILHRHNEETEEENALESIKLLQNFLCFFQKYDKARIINR